MDVLLIAQLLKQDTLVLHLDKIVLQFVVTEFKQRVVKSVMMGIQVMGMDVMLSAFLKKITRAILYVPLCPVNLVISGTKIIQREVAFRIAVLNTTRMIHRNSVNLVVMHVFHAQLRPIILANSALMAFT